MSRQHHATGERTPRIEPLTRLATGGMADIWLSREIGAAGLERLVVVKRLLPHLAREPSIVDMFVSEARFVARLVHPNVVQIHDLGEDDEGYFLVMEYVAGCSVSELLTTAAASRAQLPLPASLCIAEQACRGAHAAHELCDPTGEPLGLVHRDISPHNLMIGPSGEVKLLDFGIAKATFTPEATRTGALKGKHGYMSPEQCAGTHLDRRSDVFALGIVCWELFTGARLFKRETEYATMHAIVSGEVPPPSALRPDLPAAFDAVLAKALARDPADRWQTADALRRALEAAADESDVHPSHDALVAVMTDLLGARMQERERALRDAARSGSFPEPSALRAALVHAEGSVPRPESSDAAATVVQRRGPSADDDLPSDDASRPGTASGTIARPTPPPGSLQRPIPSRSSAAPAPSDRDVTVVDARTSPVHPLDAAPSAPLAPSKLDTSKVHTSTIDASTIDASTIDASTIDASTIDASTRDPSTIASAPPATATTPATALTPARPEPPPPSRRSPRFLLAAGVVLASTIAAALILALRPAADSGALSPSGSGALSSAERPPSGKPLRFGVPPTVASTVLRSELAPFLQWLGRSLDRPIELVIADSYDHTGEMVVASRVDFALLPPLLFVRSRVREPRLHPLALRLFDGSRASDGYLLVRDDSTMTQPADLRGHRICYVDRSSTTGFLLPRIWMRKAGLTPDRDVEAVLSGDHMTAMRDLTAGKCDAAAVYSGAYLSARQEGIAVGRLRVMGITGRVPQDVLVASPEMSPADATTLRTALLGFEPRRDIDAGRIGEVLGITGFADFQSAELDAIREAAESEGLIPSPPPR